MNALVLAAANPFDLRAWLVAPHAQHPVIVHFPIALFIMSAVFEVLALWRKQPAFASVAYFNLLGAAISIPFTVATGLAAWQWQLEGATLKGNLRLHLVFALTTAAIILLLFWRRYRLRTNGRSPRIGYFALMAVGLLAITVTGHLGGILSGVEGP
ncbi:MAG TPA: DUF2231 domain-containing protein [Chthoniobacterales bacterium]|nr:DUF2231 domain-containing protein [Chthoniobacterales bacterium]